MENYFSSNLRLLRKGKKMTQDALALSIGKKKSIIGSYEAGDVEPSIDALLLFSNLFGVSISDLISKKLGESDLKKLGIGDDVKGKKYPQDDNPPRTFNEPSNKVGQIVTVVVDQKGNSLVPVLDAQAAAGLPVNADNPEYWKEKPTFSVPWIQFRNHEYVLIQVTGDSMTPTIYNGDWLFCRLLENPRDEIRDGYVHVIVSKDGVVCKRVLNRIDKRGAIALQSDNETYATFDLPMDQVIQIWKVEMKMSATLRNENTDLRKDVNQLKKDMLDVKDQLLKKK